MFEHTLAGSMVPERRLRLGPVSLALGLHAGILAGLAAVSVLALRPVPPGPDLPMLFVWPIPPPPDGGVAPVRGSRDARRSAGPRLEQPVPRPVAPERVPDAPPETPPDPAPSAPDGPPATDGAFGDPDGVPGSPGGDGSGGAGLGPGGPGVPDGAGTEPVPLGPSIVSPRLVLKVQPDYPSLARKARLEGRVVLRAVIGPEGTVEAAEIVLSTSPIFDAEALAAVKRWRYEPATQNGRAVSVWFNVVVDFVLR